jgi:hypothetical protein
MKSTISVSLNLDRFLVKRAKIMAAKIGTPLNVVVSQQLRAFLDSFEQSEVLGNQNFIILTEFSLGIRSANDTAKALAIDSTADLNRLLSVAKLPRPTVPEHEIMRMVEALEKFSGGDKP